MREVASHWLQSHHTQNGIETRKLKSKKCQKVAFTSGKGGVGKTSISLKSALELSELGYRVLLIDCDFNLSNTALKLGLPLKEHFYHYLLGKKKLEECIYFYGKLHLLSSCNGSFDLYQADYNLEDYVLDIISKVESQYDFIILDCPAGISKDNVILNAYADYRIFVITPDKSSITDSYSFMKILSKEFDVKHNHIFVNKYSEKKQFNKVVKTISETAENFLGSRTSVIGSMKMLDYKAEQFDHFFLQGKNSPLHKNFIKCITKFAEESHSGFHNLLKYEIVSPINMI